MDTTLNALKIYYEDLSRHVFSALKEMSIRVLVPIVSAQLTSNRLNIPMASNKNLGFQGHSFKNSVLKQGLRR